MFWSNLAMGMSVDAGAGGLATDHRWVPQSITPGADWVGKKRAACVRSASNAIMACGVEAV
ncbi:hypothetical protein N7463_002036 [Penicillium fimorum]|uniref:Uncharacterized protein n=1 Tax=Penicillium fimorum TaxID=1882269 RepID=A0A9W9XYA9_9EURO|nr:hypothetical protein N7463_002036 [Penicillium fimorum]